MSRAGVRFGVVLSVVAVLCALAPDTGAAQRPPPGSPAPLTGRAIIGQTTGLANTALISGRVVDGTSGTPIEGAVVTLADARGLTSTSAQATDRSGQFVFPRLTAGTAYSLSATKLGYFGNHLADDATPSVARRITVADGEPFSDATITLWRPSAITGTILDEAGEPVVGVNVRALMRILVAGVPQWATGPVALTDDLGRYRIAPLTAGLYSVVVPSRQVGAPASASSATPYALPLPGGGYQLLGPGSLVPPPPDPNGVRHAYPVTFAPSARSIDNAMMISLGPGEWRPGVDVQLLSQPVSRISGRLDGAPASVANQRLWLAPGGAEDLGVGYEAATTLSESDGRFAFPGVPAGRYTILATPGGGYEYPAPDLLTPPPPQPSARERTLVADIAKIEAKHPAAIQSTIRTRTISTRDGSSWRTSVDVSGVDLADVVIRLIGPLSISGRFVIETPEEQSALEGRGSTLEVVAEPAGADSSLRSARGGSKLNTSPPTFRLDGLLPGEYVFRIWAGGGRIKSLIWDGQDFTDRPLALSDRDVTGLVVTVTAQAASIRGTVRPAPGRPATPTTVIYFPTDSLQWQRYGPLPARLRSVPVKDGVYEVRDVPGGDYYVVATEARWADGWKDPDFLRDVAPRAARLSVGWGETKAQDLTVVSVRP